MSNQDQKSDKARDLARLIELSATQGSLSNKNDSFERQAMDFLMKQYVQLAPDQPLVVQGKRALLAELCAKGRFEEALVWEDLARGMAWKGAKAGGNVLAEVLGMVMDRTTSSWGKSGLQWPVGGGNDKDNAETLIHFLARGMEYCMPFGPGSTSSLAPHEQNTVLTFCQEDDNLLTAQQKLTLFKRAAGQICLGSTSRGKTPNWGAYIKAGLIETDTTVYWTAGNKAEPMHWVQAWEKTWQSPEEVFAHMEKLGLDSQPSKTRKMLHDLKTAHTWTQAREALNNTPGGWDHEDENGVVSWQRLLARNPVWLAEIVNETRARLRQKGSSGIGIWEQVMEGWEKKDEISNMALGRSDMPGSAEVDELVKKVPLDISRGQLFIGRKVSHYAMEHLFKTTHKQYPEFWVGENDDRQAIRAREILWNLLYNQSKGVNAATREVWAENANMLHKVYEQNPQALTGPTKAVLWCLSQFLAQYPSKLDVDVSYLAGNSEIEEPRSGEMEWAKDLIEYDRYKPHATVDILKKILIRGSLLAQTNSSHIQRAQTSPKPKM